MRINDENKVKFADDLIARISANGFDSMTKTDYQVLLLDLLKKYGDIKEKSVYEISLDLKTPENKIRNLIYSTELKYHSPDYDTMWEKFFFVLKQAELRGSKEKKVSFFVDDKMLRSGIDAELQKLGFFSDSSFNRNVMTLSCDAFEAYW